MNFIGLEYPDKTYVQYTAGLKLGFDYTFNEAHKLALSAGYRELSHKEYSEYDHRPYLNPNANVGTADHGRPLDAQMVEGYWDFGAEYAFKPIEPLTFVLGSSFSAVSPKKLLRRNSGNGDGLLVSYKEGEFAASKNLFNYQLGTFYDLTDDHELFFTFAKKSRFATMRERYQRLANGNPANPNLKPETAMHYELGYRGVIGDWLKLNSSVYYSYVKDLIVSRGRGQSAYFINLDRAGYFGIEAGGEALFNQYLSAGAVFNFMKWNNRANDDKLTGLPSLTSTIYGVISPLDGLSIIPQVNLSSRFYWQSNPLDQYLRAPGFVTADLKALYDINENFSVEIGAKNIFDKEYAYEAYYPQPGTTYFLGVTSRY
jgi:iron complex outermembrane receptor protein